MKRRGVRWLSAGLLVGASAGLMEISSLVDPAVSSADDAADTALILGYAETPTPMQSYVDQVMSVFIDPKSPYFPDQPVYPGYAPVVVSTPEGADYSTVLTQGAPLLDQAIQDHLSTSDDHVVVWGYSESSSIATQELINLGKEGNPNQDNLSFVLLENLNNPNGGYLERFPELAGTPFPATPADTPYDVTIYTVQYSASSDYPLYTSNLLADENAMAGFVELHPLLLPGYPSAFDFSSLNNAVLENVSSADVNTDYYLIPTQNLPLLDFSRDLGGNAMADLMQPDMRVLIDLGYDYTSNADVLTPASMASPDYTPAVVDEYLLAGANQGIIAALVDVGVLQKSDLVDMYPYVPDVKDLIAGALTTNDPTAATADATASANALVEALTASDNPLAPALLTFLPGFADDLAGYFGNFLPSV